jgi:predicted transcriptional regulator
VPDELSTFIQQQRDTSPAFRGMWDDVSAVAHVIDTLVARRHNLRLTQAEVATRMGVSPHMVSEFEAPHDGTPRLEMVLRYARAVEATVTMTITPH